MKRTMTMMALTIAVLAAAAPVALGLTAGHGNTGSVGVTARVLATADLHVTHGQALVRSNAPWTATIETAQGAEYVSGTKTAGMTIQLPADTTAVWVVLK